MLKLAFESIKKQQSKNQKYEPSDLGLMNQTYQTESLAIDTKTNTQQSFLPKQLNQTVRNSSFNKNTSIFHSKKSSLNNTVKNGFLSPQNSRVQSKTALSVGIHSFINKRKTLAANPNTYLKANIKP